MNNPFIENDVVYHATMGKGRVVAASPTSQYIHVVFGNDVDADEVEVCHCSFEPWPVPVHERPIEDGWWLLSSKTLGRIPLIRRLHEGKVYDLEDQLAADIECYNYHRFLGKDWK